MEIIKKLISTVARAYYNDTENIVLDILLENEHVRDDLLAEAIGIKIKELQKVCGKLKAGGLIQVQVYNNH